MKSIGQVRRALPPEFLSRLAELFSPVDQDKILAGYGVDRPVTLRANPLKADVRSLMAELSLAGIKFERVLWYPEALVIKDRRERDLASLAAYREGRLYLQSLSSMVPPLLLAPQADEDVLDMAAAPGSKTTQLAALMRNQGHILANELNPLRAERLKYNLRLQGVKNAEVNLGDGRLLGRRFPETFDRVLLDAPCSGEGLFSAGEPATWRHWSPPQVRKLAALQRKLFTSAFQVLKPGGTLVYSTCTLSPEENESLVDWALAEFAGALETLPMQLRLPEVHPALAEADGQRFAPGVARAVRLLPSRTWEGFFVCRFRKRA